ncbi:MAG: ThuA domain-containing protein, partial [Candidatus Hydrogenedentes bacterium]|nr:ThuA domain-containing protein [Candidatus Hydrogenedentota bacterium]
MKSWCCFGGATGMLKAILCVLAATFTLSVDGAARQPDPSTGDALRVLILTGRHNHDWEATTPFLKTMYEESGRFVVDVTEDPASLDADALEPYDVLVDNYAAYPDMTGRQWGKTAEDAIVEFVRQGKGMVLFHAAVASFLDWPEFLEMAGCSWGEDSAHGRRHEYNVDIVDHDHPITHGLHSFATSRDELYHRLDMHPPIQLLARSYSMASAKGSGRYEPMVLTTDIGQGRCFYTAMGHDVEAMEGAGFQAVMLRATEWAATGAVNMPPPDALPARKLQAVVLTGGHDFDEEAFPKLFEGDEAVLYDAVHQEKDSKIFEDISDWPYDVIVLYNMSNKISEKGRANFLRLLDQGTGLVVLHHAIIAYQEWPEFARIIGVNYYQEESTINGVTYPKSTYKHDVDMPLRIEDGSHPVTQGLKDFVVHEETY